MSVPVGCPKCGKTIGEINFPVVNIHSEVGFRQRLGSYSECNHPEPTRTESMNFIGLIKQVRIKYPETHTSSSWVEYVGPPSRLLLWLAIMFYGDPGVVINHQWAYWKWNRGLYGDGAQELANLQSKTV